MTIAKIRKTREIAHPTNEIIDSGCCDAEGCKNY